MTTEVDTDPRALTGPPGAWTRCVSCPICEATTVVPLCQARDHHYGNEGVWSYSRCMSCGAGFLNPFPPAEALGAFYPQTYYSFGRFGGLKDRAKLWYRKLMAIPTGTRDPKFASPGAMLDLGCGSGAALKAFRDRGWTVTGVEISAQAAQTGREAYALDIHVGHLTEAGLPAGHFDYVRANHSLEHMTDPHQIFAEVFRILKPGGLLHIGVPNLDGLGAKWFGSHWFLFGAPVHVFEFTPASLRELGRRAGFAVQRITYNSDYSNVLGSLQALANRHKPVRVASQGWIYRNPLLVFLAQRVVDVFDLLRRGDVVEVTYLKPAGE